MPKLERELREVMEDRVQLPRVHSSGTRRPPTRRTRPRSTCSPTCSAAASLRGSTSRSSTKNTSAQSATAFNPTREISGTFQISVTGKPGTTPAQLEEAIKAELARLKTNPPTAEEVERAYNSREASSIYGLQTVGGFGGKDDKLNTYATYLGKPNHFEADLARYRAVRAADVARVASQYLTDKRLVMTVVPRGSGQTSAVGPAPQSPRESIAPPRAQTAGQTQAGTTNAASQTERTGTAQGTGAATGQPAGAQTQPKPETAASMPAGAAPPTTAAPALRAGAASELVEPSSVAGVGFGSLRHAERSGLGVELLPLLADRTVDLLGQSAGSGNAETQHERECDHLFHKASPLSVDFEVRGD